jgi:sugar lactone lactonase YvrE
MVREDTATMCRLPLAAIGCQLILIGSSPGLAGCQEQASSESSGFDVVYGDPDRQARGFDPDPWAPIEVLDPATFASPDGTWRFTQTPLQREGSGPSSGKLQHLDTLVWEGTFPLTFESVVLTDAGQVAACGVAGDFQLWTINPEGVRRVVQRIRPTGSNFLHTRDNPRIAGLFIHEDEDRLVLRVADPDVNRAVEEWLVYRLATGEPLVRLRPKECATDAEALWSIIDVRPLRSTPLTLVQWLRLGGETVGTRFAVLDSEGTELWYLDLPEDFEPPDDESDSSRLDELRRTGTILSSSAPARFEVAILREEERVAFSVERYDRAEGAWEVREVGRFPHAFVAQQASNDAVVDIELTLVEAADLKVPDMNNNPVHSVVAFGFAELGEIEFVREARGSGYELILLDRTGGLQSRVPVRGLQVEAKSKKHWCKVSSERWVLIFDPWGGNDPATAWSIDAVSGEATELVEFDCPGADGVAPDGSGGFIVTASYVAKYTGLATLRAFDIQGHLRWRIGDWDHDDRIRSPEDVAVTSEGAIVVLENPSNRLQVFDLEGTLTKTIGLAEAWGHAQYPTSVIADDGGGVIVLDFAGSRRLWRTPLDEEEASSSFLARYSDGRTTRRLPERLQVASDGSLWTTDGNVLLRLDENGTEVGRFGRSADSTDLVEPHTAAVDEQGRLCVLDGATNALHVFDLEGRRIFIGRPLPDDFGDLRVHGITTDSDGSTFVETDQGTYVGFDSEGRRTGKKKLGRGTTRFVPGTQQRWTEARSDRLLLLDGELKARLSLEKLPDGRWFHYIVDFAVARDGSVAVLDWEDTNGNGKRVTLATYGPDGSPRHTYELPAGTLYHGLAHGGEWLACDGGGAVLFVHEASGTFRNFRATREAGLQGLGFLEEGREFCVADLKNRTIRRYETPTR